MIKKNKILFFTLLVLPVASFCQQVVLDTAALVKTYTQVMSFSKQPYLHYTSITKLSATVILQPEDTMSTLGDYYIKEAEMYSNNSTDEVYVQDSLMVQISNTRRTIWISKIPVGRKQEQMASSVDGKGVKEIQQLLQKNYVLSQKNINKNTSSISFESHVKNDTSNKPYNAIILTYNPTNNLPKSILIIATIQYPANEEAMASIQEQGINSSKILKEINGVKILERTQQMIVTFTNIEAGKDKVMAMPRYAACITYDAVKAMYVAIGKHKDYEVTKLF